MKIYLKDLTPEEIIKRLKNGEVPKSLLNRGIIKLVDGVMFMAKTDGSIIINPRFEITYDFYFEIEEPFEIKEIGVYKTRDGRKAFVSYISKNPDSIYKVSGIIQGEYLSTDWTIEGSFNTNCKNDTDIISKWED